MNTTAQNQDNAERDLVLVHIDEETGIREYDYA